MHYRVSKSPAVKLFASTCCMFTMIGNHSGSEERETEGLCMQVITYSYVILGFWLTHAATPSVCVVLPHSITTRRQLWCDNDVDSPSSPSPPPLPLHVQQMTMRWQVTTVITLTFQHPSPHSDLLADISHAKSSLPWFFFSLTQDHSNVVSFSQTCQTSHPHVTWPSEMGLVSLCMLSSWHRNWTTHLSTVTLLPPQCEHARFHFFSSPWELSLFIVTRCFTAHKQVQSSPEKTIWICRPQEMKQFTKFLHCAFSSHSFSKRKMLEDFFQVMTTKTQSKGKVGANMGAQPVWALMWSPAQRECFPLFIHLPYGSWHVVVPYYLSMHLLLIYALLCTL